MTIQPPTVQPTPFEPVPFEATAEQQTIIDYPQQHVRVAAGAGTGKTTTIVERLGAFVERGGKPSRALGITFTVKASDELRSKLSDRIGAREGREEVEVSTYHGFASSILDEFGAYAGYDSGALLLDDGHRSELGRLVLRDTATNLDLTSMKDRVADLLSLDDGLARHLRRPSELAALAPAGSSDDPDSVWHKRMDLIAVVVEYRAKKEALHLVEFSDLILKAVRLVTDHPTVAGELAGRYDVVLLDEYQDTDPAQRLLLTSIFGPKASVTAVGDTDQTIYEWRGASLNNFSAFPTHFPRSDSKPTETLPLSLNRRSDRMILDLANTIRDMLPTLAESEPLTPRDDAGDGRVQAGWFLSERDEAWWIAADIVRQHDEGTPWSDIAVLVRKRAWIPLLVEALNEHDIPTSVSDPGTLLTVPEVADVLAWLRVVSEPDDENALLRILMGGQYRLGMADLNALRIHAKKLNAATIMGAIIDRDGISSLSTRTLAALDRFADIHEGLVQFAQANTVENTITATINTIGFWDEAAALPPGEATTARLNIARFVGIAHGWRPIEGQPNVRRFLRYIDALNESGRDEALTPPIHAVPDAIELTTMHGAKGLEWSSVYLPGLQVGDFPMNTRKYDDPDAHATVVPYELRLDAESLEEFGAATGEDRKDLLKTRDYHSELRLAYVAVTRARHSITLSGHAWQDSVARPKKPSEFLAMARNLPGASVVEWVEDPGRKPALLVSDNVAVEPDPLFQDGVGAALRTAIRDDEYLRTAFRDLTDAVATRVGQLELEIADLGTPHVEPPPRPFSTSVTNLVALAQCPLKFKWIHHDKLPRRPTSAALKGTEFHRRVELHNLGVIALDDASASGYDAVEDVDSARDDADALSDRSERHLVDPWTVFEGSRFATSRARFAEVPFEVAIGSGSVRGKIDAVYEDDNGSWEIVDYKSGRANTTDAQKVQLEAYAIAAADGAFSSTKPSNIQVSFAYFGGGQLTEVTEDVDDGWLSSARAHVSDLVTRGAEGPWEATPSVACTHCDFKVHCEPGKAWLAARR